MLSTWLKNPANVAMYVSFFMLLALTMALRSVASHALIGDNLTYVQALSVAVATCSLWAALLPQVFRWSDHISAENASWFMTMAAHVALAAAFVVISVGWRFSLDLLFPSLRRVHGSSSTVFGIYLLTGLGRSLLLYLGAVAAAHAWKRYRISGVRPEPEICEPVSLTQSEFPSPTTDSSASPAQRFLIKTNGRILFVEPEDIDWIEAAGNYVSLHAGEKSYLLRESMRGIEEQLDPSRFLRVHRSAIVQLNRVREVQVLPSGRHQAIFISGARATLGRSGAERLKPAILRLAQTTSA